MLSHLSIQNLAVVEHLELSFETKVTVFTGETGAGKSILMDALSLALGERADSSIVRHGAKQAEVSASFEIQKLPLVKEFLTNHDLECENDCILRRTLSDDGRSRSYINGKMVPLSQLRELGEYLVNIHGQHQHQALLKPEHQRQLLDEYAGHSSLCDAVKGQYHAIQSKRKTLSELQKRQDNQDKLTFLEYQLQEIDDLQLQPQELQQLEEEHKQLSHSEEWVSSIENALSALQSDQNGTSTYENGTSSIHASLNYVLSEIAHLKSKAKEVSSAQDLLSNALIQINEAEHELRAFQSSIKIDPERLIEVDKRLSQIHALSRKHRIQPDEILSHREKLYHEIQSLSLVEKDIEAVTKALKESENQYLKVATLLSESRKQAAKSLQESITKKIKSLEMPNGFFSILFKQKEIIEEKETVETVKKEVINKENNTCQNNNSYYSINGLDEIEFLVTTNPGQPEKPIRKIASGGELSRISLAIQVIISEKTTTPTLIFDEVDVGVSGKTAETVGKLLRQLGNHTQVLCVTHLPQVAAQGHHHFKVEKLQSTQSTTTQIFSLETQDKIQEIARLLGGEIISEHAVMHAKSMLETIL